VDLEVVSEVVAIVAPVRGDAFVDRPGSAIPKSFRIAVLADRSVCGIPRVELLPAPGFAPEHGLELAHLLLRDRGCPSGVRIMYRSGIGGERHHELPLRRQ